jgi:hypothetical protein
MRLHHEHGPVCPLCTEKLKTAHPLLVAWFQRVKARHINAHVSWAYRGPEDQEKAFKEGKTKLHYPDSKHNNMFNGKPCSLALDLFILDEDGVARFPGLWYAKLNVENEANKEPIFWGGRFKSFGDLDHWQLIVPVAPKEAA